MTEFWVSKGNKWCDFCKIYISDNTISIRNHELGQRHKENVTKRVASIREKNAALAKEEKEAARALEQIEEKATRSYQKDVSKFQQARNSNAHALAAQGDGQGTTLSGEWEFDSSSGYYYNQSNGCYYDANSGFYYTDALGKWVTQEEALAASRASTGSIRKKTVFGSPSSASAPGAASQSKNGDKSKSGTTPLIPKKSFKGGAPSSLTVNKRKRQEKPKVISEEEAAALKAREAARKRVEAREKPMLGIYKH